MKRKANIEIQLREQAEKILAARKHNKVPLQKKTEQLDELLHELQIYQVELEMQNDELRTTQLALEAEKIRFENLFNLSPVGFFMLRHQGMISECNATGEKLISAGKPVIEQRFQTFVYAEDYQNFYHFLRNLQQKKKLGVVSLRMVRANRTHFNAEVYGIATGGNETKPYFYLAVIDVTEKKEVEILQHQTSLRLRMALNASVSGTWSIEMASGNFSLDEYGKLLIDPSGSEDINSLDTFLNKVEAHDRQHLSEKITQAVSKKKRLFTEFRVKNNDSTYTHIEVHGNIASVTSPNDHFIGLLTDISPRKKIEKQSEDIKNEQEKLRLRVVIETQEQERQRISNALHDSVGQLLYVASLKLQQCDAKNHEVSQVIDLLGQAIKETRNICFELMPSILTDFGLKVAVAEMISRTKPEGLQVNTTFTGFRKKISPEAELFVFRILQELINNVVRHSKASECNLHIGYKNAVLKIDVKDNGCGMNPYRNKKRGTGLLSIKNRIGLYQGEMQINSKKGQGTHIAVVLVNV